MQVITIAILRYKPYNYLKFVLWITLNPAYTKRKYVLSQLKNNYAMVNVDTTRN
jgi:hypothetical protein